MGLGAQCVLEGQAPLRECRRPVGAQADLGERSDSACELERLGEGGALGDDAIDEAPCERLGGVDRSAGEEHVHCPAVADEAWEAHGPAVDERHPPPAAEHAEHRRGGGDTEVAPEGEFEASGDRVPLDGGDDRFRGGRAGDPEHRGAVRVICGVGAVHLVEVEPGAERPVRSGEDGDVGLLVRLEGGEGLDEGRRRGQRDGVPPRRAVDHHDGDRAPVFHSNQHGADATPTRLYPLLLMIHAR